MSSLFYPIVPCQVYNGRRLHNLTSHFFCLWIGWQRSYPKDLLGRRLTICRFRDVRFAREAMTLLNVCSDTWINISSYKNSLSKLLILRSGSYCCPWPSDVEPESKKSESQRDGLTKVPNKTHLFVALDSIWRVPNCLSVAIITALVVILAALKDCIDTTISGNKLLPVRIARFRHGKLRNTRVTMVKPSLNLDYCHYPVYVHLGGHDCLGSSFEETTGQTTCWCTHQLSLYGFKPLKNVSLGLGGLTFI